MWQAVLVALIVLAAALYAAWTLLPMAVRLRVAQRAGEWSRRPGRPAWLARAASALERAARKRAGACSDCSAVQASPAPRDDRPRH